VAAVLNHSLIGFLAGLLIVPLSSVLYIGLCAGFFYYVFLFVFKSSVLYHDLFILIVFAALPSFLAFMFMQKLPPIILLGIALQLVLLRQAFFAVFRMPKPGLNLLMVGVFVVFSGCWVASSLNLEKSRQSLKKMATPESLDILENEMKN
jgi:hypothetical protein